MGPYKITMRLDFCGNRATSRGRVICCVRSLLLLHFFFTLLFLFFFSFFLSRVAGSEQVQPFQRIVDRTTNYGTIILYHLTRRLLSLSTPYSLPLPPTPILHIWFIELFPLLVRFSAISLLFQLFAPYLVFLLAFSDC